MLAFERRRRYGITYALSVHAFARRKPRASLNTKGNVPPVLPCKFDNISASTLSPFAGSTAPYESFAETGAETEHEGSCTVEDDGEEAGIVLSPRSSLRG